MKHQRWSRPLRGGNRSRLLVAAGVAMAAGLLLHPHLALLLLLVPVLAL